MPKRQQCCREGHKVALICSCHSGFGARSSGVIDVSSSGVSSALLGAGFIAALQLSIGEFFQHGCRNLIDEVYVQ
jgi:hypothetical protein